MILLVAAPLSPAHATRFERTKLFCSSFLSLFSSHEAEVSNAPKAPIPPDQFLSQGYSATTYIAYEATSPPRKYVKKVYKSNEFGDRRFHFDVEGLIALKKLVTGKMGQFEVVIGERYMEPAISSDEAPRPSVRLPFVAGRTLHSLLADAQVSVAKKTELTQIYAEKIANLAILLRSSPLLKSDVVEKPEEVRYFFDGVAVPLSMLKAELEGAGQLLIKSDNVIVDPDVFTRMTIVDPY